MLTKIDNTLKYSKQLGGFGIQILYPGLAFPGLHNTGFATLGKDRPCQNNTRNTYPNAPSSKR